MWSYSLVNLICKKHLYIQNALLYMFHIDSSYFLQWLALPYMYQNARKKYIQWVSLSSRKNWIDYNFSIESCIFISVDECYFQDIEYFQMDRKLTYGAENLWSFGIFLTISKGGLTFTKKKTPPPKKPKQKQTKAIKKQRMWHSLWSARIQVRLKCTLAVRF